MSARYQSDIALYMNNNVFMFKSFQCFSLQNL